MPHRRKKGSKTRSNQHRLHHLAFKQTSMVYVSSSLRMRKGKWKVTLFPDRGWVDIRAQLQGTTLRIWDHKVSTTSPKEYEIMQAVLRVGSDAESSGTDGSSLSSCFSLTLGHRVLFFSTTDQSNWKSWIAAIRLSIWERSKLSEFYTSHLFLKYLCEKPRASFLEGRAPTPLEDGYFFGNAFVYQPGEKQLRASITICAGPRAYLRAMQGRNNALIFNVKRAYAVHTCSAEKITGNSEIQIMGTIESSRDGVWSKDILLVIKPTGEIGDPGTVQWLSAIHDAFQLYGRPQHWTWDIQNPVSLLYGFPVKQQHKEVLLGLEDALSLNSHDMKPSEVYDSFDKLLSRRLATYKLLSLSKPPDTAKSAVSHSSRANRETDLELTRRIYQDDSVVQPSRVEPSIGFIESSDDEDGLRADLSNEPNSILRLRTENIQIRELFEDLNLTDTSDVAELASFLHRIPSQTHSMSVHNFDRRPGLHVANDDPNQPPPAYQASPL